MNDTSSLILAISILSVGGLGLYMYKNVNIQDENNDSYDVDGKKNDYNGHYDELFAFGDFFGDILGFNKHQDQTQTKPCEDKEYLYEDNEIMEHKAKSRSNKGKKEKKQSGTKRKY
jgi:hypothetical protein